MDADAIAIVRNALQGAVCIEAYSSNELRSGVFYAGFDNAALEVTCEWSLRSAAHRDAALTELAGRGVLEVSVDPDDHTMAIEFEGGTSFRATPDSPAHESWILSKPDGEMIGVGPGSSWWRFPPRG